MSRIRVVVTAEDIAEGEPREPEYCPLAVALSRVGFGGACVWDDHWTPRHSPNLRSYPLSRGAVRFRLAFDKGLPVQPATFYLEGPAR